jgi:TonB family protein
MQRLVFIFLSILTVNSSCSETICEKANRKAANDFSAGQYFLHSEEVLPVDNVYFYVLREDYNINWRFTDSLDYYHCYDSAMVTLLNQKFRIDVLANANKKADSLASLPDWSKEAEYPGGIGEVLKYVVKRLNTGGLKTNDISGTKLFVQFTVDTTGQVIDPKIMKGEINKSIDQQVLDIVASMKWTPAHQYGRPVETRMVIPLQLEFSE